MALTNNKSILDWVDEKIALVKPDSVMWIARYASQRGL